MKGLSSTALAMGLIVAACAERPAELLVRGRGPDGCVYEGPLEFAQGPVELLASPSGLGEIFVVIREVEKPSADNDVAETDIGRIVATVENDNDVNLARTSAELGQGEYVVICHYQDFDGIVGTLTVTS
jgi:hypothetical protein